MPKLSRPVDSSDHILGPEDAPVTLVEYGDFQCEHCGAAFPILQRMIQKMGTQLRFVFRHFPLTETHEYAGIAAEAAELAAAQGKFWQMHNEIYTHQDQLDVEHLFEFAQSIGLDLDQFHKDLQQHTYEEKVHAQFMDGVRSGVNGTPTLFINGQRYNGMVELRELSQALEEAAETAEV